MPKIVATATMPHAEHALDPKQPGAPSVPRFNGRDLGTHDRTVVEAAVAAERAQAAALVTMPKGR